MTKRTKKTAAEVFTPAKTFHMGGPASYGAQAPPKGKAEDAPFPLPSGKYLDPAMEGKRDGVVFTRRRKTDADRLKDLERAAGIEADVHEFEPGSDIAHPITRDNEIGQVGLPPGRPPPPTYEELVAHGQVRE